MTTFFDILREGKKVTFLLGAGASCSAGLPIDSELRDNIILKLDDPNFASYFKFSSDNILPDIIHFKETLDYGKFDTIDDLINFQEEFLKIGKMAVALSLLEYEGKSKKLLTSKDHWYGSFFQQLCHQDLIDYLPNISFITLNYDRSLEYFYSKFKVARKINHELNITHLHGKIASLPWEQGFSIDYGGLPKTPEYLFNQANEICSLSEEHKSLESYALSKSIIDQSSHLFILGFGFHKKILEKLNLTSDKFHSLRSIYSLSLGLQKPILDLYPHINFYNEEMNCNGFIKNLDKKLDNNLRRRDQRVKPPKPKKRLSSIREMHDTFSLNDYDPFPNTDNWTTRW